MSHNKFKRALISGILTVLLSPLLSQDAYVENVRFVQRTDGSLLVDIYYDVKSAGGLPLKVNIEASADSGINWDLPCTSLSGDLGEYITEGINKHVLWDFYADNPDTSGSNFMVRVWAECMICGETLTEDLTLTKNIICNDWDYLQGSGYIFLINKPGITLDLNGFTLMSNSFNFGSSAIWMMDADRTTIKNGTIDKGFSWGIVLERSDSVTIEKMVLRNTEFANGDTFVMGVATGDSHDILVRDCKFEYLEVHHKEAVVMGNNTSFLVDNIELIGGSVGVNISGNEIPSVGTVTNSRFEGCRIAGVLVHATTDALVANNIFERGGGVNTDGGMGSEISGLIIEQNDFMNGGGYDGVSFWGTSGGLIRNNNIRNNNTGISMGPGRACGPDSLFGGSCVYSTSNEIRDNVVLGNRLDLYHDENSLENIWENNTYETALGSDIYSNEPSRARDGLYAVDSVATEIYEDAILVHVAAGNLDTLGRGVQWNYFYQSPSGQRYDEYWYQDQRVIKRGIPNEMSFDGFNPLPENWMDSDSAISLCDNLGGKQFRDQFELETIEMGLHNTHSLYWTIHYIARDTAFSVEIDATLK